MTSLKRILFVSILAALFAGAGMAQDAKIVKIIGSGPVTLLRGGSAVAAAEGSAITLNDDLTTGAGVEVYVQAYPGAIATIKENSHVLIAELAAQQALLDLKQGNVVSQLDPAK